MDADLRGCFELQWEVGGGFRAQPGMRWVGAPLNLVSYSDLVMLQEEFWLGTGEDFAFVLASPQVCHPQCISAYLFEEDGGGEFEFV